MAGVLFDRLWMVCSTYPSLVTTDADWFVHDGPRALVVEETVCFATGHTSVASSAALEAWKKWWTSTQRGDFNPAIKEAWLEAWRRWLKPQGSAG